jgi:hypothetical protein
MTKPDGVGQRFIVAPRVIWFGEIAKMLRTELGQDAARVPTATLTDDDFRALADAVPELRTLLPLLGRELEHSSAKAQRVLGWRARPVIDTVAESARCLLAFGSAV